MKTLPRYRHRRVNRVSALFFVLVALVMAATACNGPDAYQLTVSSTAGGSVATPGEDTFNYESGTIVELVATPDDDYEFDAWTGDTDDIADASSPSTNITMNADYIVTASFKEQGEDGGGGANPILP
jgi:hypothetical protein